jgi:hypothetical protein
MIHPRVHSEFDFVTRRRYDYDDESSLKEYNKKLLKDKEIFENLMTSLCINSEVSEGIIEALDNEINLIQFALELKSKKRLARFNKWISSNKQDGIYKRFEQRDNGKIKAIISVSDNISSKRVSLNISNSSSFKSLYFINDDYSLNCCLRSDKSVKAKVHEYKQVAELYFQKCQYPHLSEVRNFKILKKLLDIGGEQ